jgi:putative ABC transport system ATP-binding protein
MLKSSNLQYRYPGGNAISFPDLEVETGSEWLILGQSGSGKTTMLNILSGLVRPTQGDVVLNGVSLSQLSGARMDRFRGKHIGIVFQQSHFIRSLNVEQNLLLAQRLAGVKRDRKQIRDVLEKLGIADKTHRSTTRLSVGEQQRVSIARAVITKPLLILADEPTSALDDHHCGAVHQLLRASAAETGASLIIVTHDTRLKDLVKNRIEL